MANHKAKLSDKGFCNWIKSNLAISITKDGLQDSVCTKLQSIHEDILKDTRTDDQIHRNIFCSVCLTPNIIRCSKVHPCSHVGKICPFHKYAQFRACPDRICDKIRDKVIQAHVFKKPSWKNTRAEMWCNSYWEYAKCFMPPDGYSDKNSYFETDFNGVISIVTNHSAFTSEVDDINICGQVRSMVNGVRHNSELSVFDQELENIINMLKRFLSCCEEFRNNPHATKARLKLEQLKDDPFIVTEGDMKQCLQNQYDDLVKDLKKEVIQFNKDEHGTTSISPALDEMDSPLLDIYVQPIINKVQSGEVAPVTSFQDIFFGEDGRYREIYLCSDTGLGKTVYGKRLVLMWCQANEAGQNEGNFTREEIDVIKHFDLVFFISLKESDQVHRDVDDMIEQQVIKNLAHASNYKTEFIEKVLTQETCLIILDGLDEWAYHREHIPRRKARQTCTFFTTTRPWKFSIAKIKQSKIDQQLQITGIDAAGKQKLKSNIRKNIVDNDAECQWKDFDKEVASKNIVDFETSPMLLLYLICLWLDGKPLGDSRCGLYSNIIEMLLQKIAEMQQIEHSAQQTKNIPKCFTGNKYCCTHFNFIQSLSHLAFVTLFNRKIENKFVFTDVIAKENMSEQCLEFWLRSGILTQIKGKKKFSARDIRVSFIHKSFHEFFAALYLALREQQDNTNIVETAFSDQNSILQNASFLEFLCGLSNTASRNILNSVVALLGKDKLTQRLRNNTYAFLDYWENCDLKENLQHMLVACVHESKDNGYNPDYHLEDIFLNFGSEVQTRYADALCDLTDHKDVKSIKFGRFLSSSKAHELIQRLNVQGMKSLQKLDLWGSPDTGDVEILLGASPKTLTCLLIHGCEMKEDKEYEKHIEISEASLSKLQTLDNLACIDLYSIALKHELIGKLFSWMEKKKSMSQIKIARVQCMDHLDSTCKSAKSTFDLSEHRNLKIIGLGNMCVASIKVDHSALEEFWAECNESVVSSFLTVYAPSASSLHTFVVEFINSKAVVEQILDTLPHLNNLRYLQLKGMDLQERELTVTSQKTLKHVRLIEVELECRTLKNFIDELGTYSHHVTVEIASCVVKPNSSDENITLENLRDMIVLSADKYTVIANLRCSGHNNAFAFRTIPC